MKVKVICRKCNCRKYITTNTLKKSKKIKKISKKSSFICGKCINDKNKIVGILDDRLVFFK